MESLKIKSVLATRPRHKPRELKVITRGATAKLDYILTDKWFSFDLLEQLTFTLKQGKRLIWFNLFIYLQQTSDTKVDITKTYYTNVEPIPGAGRHCTATKVINPLPDPAAAGYYEVVRPADGQNDLYYLFDDHFYHVIEDGVEYVSLILTPDETTQFYPTFPGAEVKYEITIRFNTDAHPELANKDSVIIEPQSPLKVLDSLYSELTDEGYTCGDTPDRVIFTDRVVK